MKTKRPEKHFWNMSYMSEIDKINVFPILKNGSMLSHLVGKLWLVGQIRSVYVIVKKYWLEHGHIYLFAYYLLLFLYYVTELSSC